jgi:hypothetical protein
MKELNLEQVAETIDNMGSGEEMDLGHGRMDVSFPDSGVGYTFRGRIVVKCQILGDQKRYALELNDSSKFRFGLSARPEIELVKNVSGETDYASSRVILPIKAKEDARIIIDRLEGPIKY